jgi:recombinational DNA repair protein RecT
MSDGPPSWVDDAPPPGPSDYGGNSGNNTRSFSGSSGDRRRNASDLSPEQCLTEAAAFYAWIDSRAAMAELRTVLPDHIDIGVFMAAAKTAVMLKPHQLLRPDLRPSLLTAIARAAAQGLKPDGKEGALVARWDSQTSRHAVVWQPMVWGVTKLGRETGSIANIRAQIVFHGERFEIIQGDEDRLVHVVDPDIVENAYQALNGGLDSRKNPIAKPDAFFAQVRAAYCVITAPDGRVTKRWMMRERIKSLRDASRAESGPWNSRWMDEMILKAVILFTAKWIDLDMNGAAAKRFHAALMDDLEIDFDQQGDVTPRSAPAALPPPGAKISTLEGLLNAGTTRQPEPAVTGRAADPAVVSRPTQGPPQRTQEPPTEPERKDPPSQAVTTTKRSGQTREAWVAEQEKVIAALPDHDALSAHRRTPDYSQRYDVLRQENPELAKRLDEAFAARTVAIGPLDGDQQGGVS